MITMAFCFPLTSRPPLPWEITFTGAMIFHIFLVLCTPLSPSWHSLWYLSLELETIEQNGRVDVE
jgi:hypothetical protein